MSAVLLDTHTLVWLMSNAPLSAEAFLAIAEAQEAGQLLVSPISAWEVGVAIRKPSKRPDIGGGDAAAWFEAALKIPGARLVNLTRRIAVEAALIPAVFNHADPGDCFLIATARVRKVAIVTRDRKIIELARQRPAYLKAIAC